MCRSIKTLHNFKPPATGEEIRASSLQFVRKVSGLPWLDDLVRARRPGRLPVVLSWDGGDSRSTDGEAPSMSAR